MKTVEVLINTIVEYEYLTMEQINEIVLASVSNPEAEAEVEVVQEKKGNKWVNGLKRVGVGMSVATLLAVLAEAALAPVTQGVSIV